MIQANQIFKSMPNVYGITPGITIQIRNSRHNTLYEYRILAWEGKLGVHSMGKWNYTIPKHELEKFILDGVLATPWLRYNIYD